MKEKSLFKLWWGIVIASFPVLFLLLKKTFFFHDEWTFIHQIIISPINFILEPHNGHFWPFFASLYLVAYRLFGLNYWPYQLLLLVFHLGNVFLLFKIVGCLTKNKFIPFFASLFFLFSSIYWEVLFSASTLPTVLSLFFIALGIYLYLAYQKSESKQQFFFSGLAFLVSGWSWGGGLLFPLLFILSILVNVIFKKKVRYLETAVYLLVQIFLISVYVSVSSGVTGSGFSDIGRILLFMAIGIKWLLVGFYTSSPGFLKIFALLIVFLAFLIYGVLRNQQKRKLFFSSLFSNWTWIILSVLAILYFYFISAYSRSQVDMRLATSSRYTYLPLYFLVIFNALIFDSLQKVTPALVKKLIIVYLIVLALANVYFFRIFYRSWMETISKPNERLFMQIVKAASKEERAEITIPNTFHDFYSPEDIYFIYSHPKGVVSQR